MQCKIIKADCEEYLKHKTRKDGRHLFDLTFFDPPFNQGKDYQSHDDDMSHRAYWSWMKRLCTLIFKNTSAGGAIYFMQREKNVQFVLEALEDSGWTLQNVIVWKKKTSAVPCERKFGLQYQIIAFATKGKTPHVFNKLRIDPPLREGERIPRSHGIFVTDVWDDIRELTSGYFAGDEPFRDENQERSHKQQSPVHLLARIILSSSKVGDLIFDPFAGTGTTLVVAKQLSRNTVGVEIDHDYYSLIKNRITTSRESDDILKYYRYYSFTESLSAIWPALLKKDSLRSDDFQMNDPAKITS
ncbi:MAG TPA: DNA methyltransferase [Nitrososphaera sp.]|nr:DNA methyltransferase [Nitrososphaera sp.]